jgi:dTMP kinase
LRSHKGLFITFEKTAEGLGGTTQARLLYQRLKGAGIETVLTKETGGTVLGEQLDKILKDPTLKLSLAAQLFLVEADRSQHYKEVLKPSLKLGKVVISDRYFDSTLVYQGSGQGWKTAFLLRLHQAATGMLMPDLTIVLDGIPFRQLSTKDRWEGMGEAFHKKVKEGMLYFASKADRYVIINANRPEEAVADDIFHIIKERFGSQLKLSLQS